MKQNILNDEQFEDNEKFFLIPLGNNNFLKAKHKETF
jgi:hypothetical protein